MKRRTEVMYQFGCIKNIKELNLSSIEQFELTGRELEVAQLILEGRSNQEIAMKLDLTVGTVKSHVKRIIDKLQVESREKVAATFQNLEKTQLQGQLQEMRQTE